MKELKSIHEVLISLLGDLGSEHGHAKILLKALTTIGLRTTAASPDALGRLLEAADSAAEEIALDPLDPEWDVLYTSLLNQSLGMNHHPHYESIATAIDYTLGAVSARDDHAIGILRIVTDLIKMSEITAADLPQIHALLSTKASSLRAGSHEWLFNCLIDLEDRMEKAGISEVVG